MKSLAQALFLALPLALSAGVVELDFPELPPDLQGNPAMVRVALPEEADGPVPLLLWFGGGAGTNNPDEVPDLVDRSRWAVAAFPYASGIPRPLAAMHAGRMEEHWAYHRPMLERLFQEIPGLDRSQVVAAGMSNGGHIVASYLAQGRPEFVENFTGFVIIEGSCREKEPAQILPNRPIYLAWGEREGGSMGLMQKIVNVARAAGMRLTSRTMENVGHGFPAREVKRAKQWIATHSLAAAQKSP